MMLAYFGYFCLIVLTIISCFNVALPITLKLAKGLQLLKYLKLNKVYDSKNYANGKDNANANANASANAASKASVCEDEDLGIAGIFYIQMKMQAAKLTLSLICVALLVFAYAISDFSLKLVMLTSNVSMPLQYKLTCIWSSHEGSMLFWVFVMQFMGFFIGRKQQLFGNFSQEASSFALYFYNIITVAFLLFIVAFANPFAVNQFGATDGMGMNIILQDGFMMIHPPQLFIGYAATSIVFAYSLAAACCNKNSVASCIKPLKSLAMVSFSVLVCAIALGAKWAYTQLGWGGFWSWDAVESISLLPILLLTIMIHINKSDITNKTFVFLWFGVLPFIATVAGTCAIRAGGLDSVHSFSSDYSAGFGLSAVLVFTSFVALAVMIKNYRKLVLPSSNISSAAASSNLHNKATLLGNLCLIVILFVVMAGAFFGYISSAAQYFNIGGSPFGSFGSFSGSLGGTSLGESYYNNLCGAIIIPLLILTYIAINRKNKAKHALIKPLSQWRIAAKYATDAVLSIGASIFLFYCYFNVVQGAGERYSSLNGECIFVFIVLFCAFLVLFSQLQDIVIYWVTFKIDAPHMLAHMGFCIMLIGAVSSVFFGSSRNVVLQKGNPYKLPNSNFVATLNSVSYQQNANNVSRITDILIEDGNSLIGVAKPSAKFFNGEDMFKVDAGYVTYRFSDIYIIAGSDYSDNHIDVTGKVTDADLATEANNSSGNAIDVAIDGAGASIDCERRNKGDEYHLESVIYYKPLIGFVWLGAVLMFLSGVYPAIKRLLGK